MLWNRIRGLWNAYHGLLAIILTVVFWLYVSAILAAPAFRGAWELPVLLIYNLAGVIGIIVASIRGRSKAPTLLVRHVRVYHRVASKPTLWVGVMFLVVLSLKGYPGVSSRLLFGIVLLFLAILYLAFFAANLLLPGFLARMLFAPAPHIQRTLLVGPLDRAKEIDLWLKETAAFDFGVRAGKNQNDEDDNVLHLEEIGDIERLRRLTEKEGVRQILLLDLPDDTQQLNQVIDVADEAGARLLIYDDTRDRFRHKVSPFELEGKNFISLRDEPLEDPVNRMLKRTMDLLISFPVVVFVLPPLCIIVVIMQRLQSPGPTWSPFYTQKRGGFADIPFDIFKFRTMRVNRPEDEKAGFGVGAGKQATADDVRIFPFGRLLRKTSLDEMPQFLNVFLGHMSVVGPRPHMVVHNDMFRQVLSEYHVRTLAKPGITGLAQAAGFRGEAKTDEDVIQRALKDIEYIENWSVGLDFSIILRTAMRVIRPHKTAY